ncbi:MAG TPA: hypothetical protein VKW76_07625 [Candidatus Binatia bacterium]|nr:hypothetical protein [Candidatus Binatia bacterium]
MRCIARHLASGAFVCLAVALSVAVGIPLGGCDRVLGLDEITPVAPGLDNGYVCECTCTYSGTGQSSTIDLRVCAPANLNPNLPNGSTPTADDLLADCGKSANSRVEFQVEKMSNKCFPRTTCTCALTGASPDTFYDASCDQGCAPNQLDATCSNWNPAAGVKDANCASANACNDPGPVCLAQQSDPAVPTPSALAAGIMGHVTSCPVDGTVEVSAAGQNPSAPLSGTVRFAPAAPGTCPAGQSCISMDYRLDTTGTIHFDGFLGLFDNTDIDHVVTLGASVPFVLPASGSALVPADATQTSGRGFQNGDRKAFFGANSDGITVGFDGHACGVQGSLVGQVGDSNDSTDFDMMVNVAGAVENTPPQASLGPDRTVECTSPDGAPVTLDATASTDPEDNIVGFGWFLGSRAGDYLGSTPTLTVQQALGSETYFVKAVDAFMQADEASATISVVDTTPPTIAGVTATPDLLWPPNHKMVPVTVAVTASDTCGAATCQITSIASNEPLNGKGDGNTPVDYEITGPLTADIRAERATGGTGRVYTITVGCSDPSGNTSSATAEVVVPHNK